MQIGNTGPATANAPFSVAVSGSYYDNRAPIPLRWPRVFGSIPELASAFQPRAALREKIGQARVNSATVVLPQVLLGGGGVGKTQLAAAYAKEAQKNGVDLIIWANAAETDQVITLYARVALELQVPGASGLNAQFDAERFIEWLETTPRSWLIILDDIDPERITQWWPPSAHRGRGQVLATTRRQDALLYGGGRTLIEISEFNLPEAQSYLNDSFKRIHKNHLLDAAVDAVCETLGLLPLALSHAAAYMVQEDTSCTEYLALFNRRRLQLGQLLPRWADTERYGREVATSLLINLDAAQHCEPVGLALPALRLAACLHPAGQPHVLWTTRAIATFLASQLAPHERREDASHDSSQTARSVLRLLHRYGLVADDAHLEPRAVRIHALTARAAREAAPTPALDRAKIAAADALLEIWPTAHRTQPDLSAVLRANTDSLASVAHEVLWSTGRHSVIQQAGYALLDAHLPSIGISYGETLVVDAKRTLGPDHPDTLSALNNLAASYGQAGRIDHAISLIRQVVADRERVLGSDHPDTLNSRANLAAYYLETGRTGEAINTAEQVATESERVLGPDHPDTIRARNTLAASYGQAGRIDDAINIAEQVVADHERVQGPDHPDTLTARANLAASYGQAGRIDDAINIAEQVVADHERVQGPDHPDTLTARANLAASYGQAGRIDDAIDLTQQVVADRERILGPDHPHTLNARTNLATGYWQAGRTDVAIALLENIAAGYERALGFNHPYTIRAKADLSAAQRAQAPMDVQNLCEALRRWMNEQSRTWDWRRPT
ncbi:tetratricopeptide repeat protein [Streptomyces sp. NBC_00005]|uniref:tetratricopeptide repeat protein n=1 Tax=Streptomyces sp. NBC_00005 TaxID=2903609 RepID=UPI00324342F5